MRQKHKNRIYKIAFFLSVLALASWLILSSLSENLLYFYTPSQLIEKVQAGEIKDKQKIKLGGLVQSDSVFRYENTLKVEFELTDLKKNIKVKYEGILPDLFREMQGVITEGFYSDGIFLAQNVLAKHDENYMPAELAKELGYIKTNKDNSNQKTFNLDKLKNQ